MIISMTIWLLFILILSIGSVYIAPLLHIYAGEISKVTSWLLIAMFLSKIPVLITDYITTKTNNGDTLSFYYRHEDVLFSFLVLFSHVLITFLCININFLIDYVVYSALHKLTHYFLLSCAILSICWALFYLIPIGISPLFNSFNSLFPEPYRDKIVLWNETWGFVFQIFCVLVLNFNSSVKVVVVTAAYNIAFSMLII